MNSHMQECRFPGCSHEFRAIRLAYCGAHSLYEICIDAVCNLVGEPLRLDVEIAVQAVMARVRKGDRFNWAFTEGTAMNISDNRSERNLHVPEMTFWKLPEDKKTEIRNIVRCAIATVKHHNA